MNQTLWCRGIAKAMALFCDTFHWVREEVVLVYLSRLSWPVITPVSVVAWRCCVPIILFFDSCITVHVYIVQPCDMYEHTGTKTYGTSGHPAE